MVSTWLKLACAAVKLASLIPARWPPTAVAAAATDAWSGSSGAARAQPISRPADRANIVMQFRVNTRVITETSRDERSRRSAVNHHHRVEDRASLLPHRGLAGRISGSSGTERFPIWI